MYFPSFNEKRTPYTHRDFILLSDPLILSKLKNTAELLQRAIIDVSSVNPKYYQDKSTWIAILKSNIPSEIAKLQAYIKIANVNEIKNREIVKKVDYVKSLGIKRLDEFIQETASHYISGTGPKKGSNFKFWNDNYYSAVDAMSDIPETASRLKKQQKKVKSLAKEQLSLAKKEVKKYERLIKDESKNFLQKAFNLKSENEIALIKAKERVEIAERNVYRAGRNADDLSDVTWLSDKFPGLEIEERTVVTEDGKHIDILVVNNVAAQ